MSNWNWQRYNDFPIDEISEGAIWCHPIYSRNGAYGECMICIDYKEEKTPYFIIAGGNDTGKLWKSPDEMYATIEEAKQVAEKTWKPVINERKL